MPKDLRGQAEVPGHLPGFNLLVKQRSHLADITESNQWLLNGSAPKI